MSKYPEPVEPFKSQTELFAWMFSMLAGAYSMLAQYEADERKRENEELLRLLSDSEPKSGESS